MVVGGQHAAVEDCCCCWRLEDKCPSLPDDTRCHGVLQGEAEDDIVKLPMEILPQSYLPFSDLLSVRVEHKSWRELSQDKGLLKSIATTDFTWAPDVIQHFPLFLRSLPKTELTTPSHLVSTNYVQKSAMKEKQSYEQMNVEGIHTRYIYCNSSMWKAPLILGNRQ